VVAWQSAPGKIYTLQSSTDLATGFSNLMMHIPATPPLNVHTDTNATSPRKFYRVLVEP
jgi:hypothetical protein